MRELPLFRLLLTPRVKRVYQNGYGLQQRGHGSLKSHALDFTSSRGLGYDLQEAIIRAHGFAYSPHEESTSRIPESSRQLPSRSTCVS